DQLLNLAMHKQLACLFCPHRCGLRLRSIDRTSDLPDVLLGMVEVHNLDRLRKMFGGQFPASTGLHLPRSRSAWLALVLTAKPSHTVTCQNSLWPSVEPHSA